MTRTKSTIFSTLLLVGVLFSASASAQTPARFDFVFEDAGSSAVTTGYIVFDLDVLPNPGFVGFLPLPDPLVIDLQATVSGAAAGDGTYVLEDFTQVIWDTGGGTLDLSDGTQVVGQPLSGDLFWGDIICSPQNDPDGEGGGCGDFNLFTNSLEPESISYGGDGDRGGVMGSGPQGTSPFTLSANGGAGEPMVLTSFIRGSMGPAAPSFAVPTMSGWSVALFATLLLIFGGLAVRLRA